MNAAGASFPVHKVLDDECVEERLLVFPGDREAGVVRGIEAADERIIPWKLAQW